MGVWPVLSGAAVSVGGVGRKRAGTRSADSDPVPFGWASVVINMIEWRAGGVERRSRLCAVILRGNIARTQHAFVVKSISRGGFL